MWYFVSPLPSGGMISKCFLSISQEWILAFFFSFHLVSITFKRAENHLAK